LRICSVTACSRCRGALRARLDEADMDDEVVHLNEEIEQLKVEIQRLKCELRSAFTEEGVKALLLAKTQMEAKELTVRIRGGDFDTETLEKALAAKAKVDILVSSAAAPSPPVLSVLSAAPSPPVLSVLSAAPRSAARRAGEQPAAEDEEDDDESDEDDGEDDSEDDGDGEYGALPKRARRVRFDIRKGERPRCLPLSAPTPVGAEVVRRSRLAMRGALSSAREEGTGSAP